MNLSNYLLEVKMLCYKTPIQINTLFSTGAQRFRTQGLRKVN